jgi:GYD domain
MSVYVLLTRIAPASLHTPSTYEQLERTVVDRVREECPEVRWLHNLVISGPYDYLDIFDAPSFESALKVSVLVRTFGHGHTELWPATDWAHFKPLLRGLPSSEEAQPGPDIEE